MFSVALVLSNDAYARSGITEAMAIDEKVRRLRGLRLGITSPGSGTDSMARTLFAARGMNPDREITIQPLGAPENILAAFGRGVTDGFFYTSPMPETAVRRGLGRIVIEPLTGEVPELVDMPYVVLGTSRSNLKNQRPKVLAAVRAYTRAMQFVHAKPQEARQLVRARFPDVDDDVFNVAFDKYVAGVPRSPVIGPEQVAKTLDWLNLLQKTPLKAKYEDLVHPDIAREASRAILSQ
jgi:NitT/TauT family transport system substrate-binding protein